MSKKRPSKPPDNPQRRAALRFAITFLGLASLLLTLYAFPYAEHGMREDWFGSYLAMYAELAGAALRLVGVDAIVDGAQITGKTSLLIAKNCDAMDVNILFASAVLAAPAGWRRKTFGLLSGVAVLVVVNVVRIVSLYFVRLHWEGSFEFVHAEVWPFAFVAIAVATFVVWSRWALPKSL